MRRHRLAAVVLVFAVLSMPQLAIARQQYTGVFTSPWYVEQTPGGLVSSRKGPGANDMCYNAPTPCVAQSAGLWTLELADMASAGVQFVAIYSFGSGNNVAPWGNPSNFGSISQAITGSGTPVRAAYFHDTNGDYLRSAPVNGPYNAFDLASGVSTVKSVIYDNNIKIYHTTMASSAWFRSATNQPVLFFYASEVYNHRELLGDLLANIRTWFLQDFGVSPLFIVEEDWQRSLPNVVVNGQVVDRSMSSTAIAKVRQEATAFYSWDFVGTVGQKGVVATTGVGFPGGGQTVVHPTNGISVGTAGVGYYSNSGAMNRDRRNGLTLTEDWNAIRSATIRMAMAWWDFDENSNISRDTATGTKYIDLLKQLVNPVAPSLASFGPISASTPSVINAIGTAFLPGASVEYFTYPAGVPLGALPMNYVSPTLMQYSYAGGVSPGTFYVRVNNGDSTYSAPIVLTVTP